MDMPYMETIALAHAAVNEQRYERAQALAAWVNHTGPGN